jgi:hypothetical protein
MKTTYAFLIFLCGILLAGCNHRPAKTKKADTRQANPRKLATADSERENNAVAQIENLPEYKHFMKWFDTANKDSSHHIAILTQAEPTKGANYYQLELGVDGPLRFEDMDLFYVDAKTFAVQHIDKETGYPTTLTQWRKSGKDDWLK